MTDRIIGYLITSPEYAHDAMPPLFYADPLSARRNLEARQRLGLEQSHIAPIRARDAHAIAAQVARIDGQEGKES